MPLSADARQLLELLPTNGRRANIGNLAGKQVYRYEWLPEKTVEVSSYEIKRAGEVKLESVYEAAAHGRWAHRASLVVETPEEGEAILR